MHNNQEGLGWSYHTLTFSPKKVCLQGCVKNIIQLLTVLINNRHTLQERLIKYLTI